MLQRPLSNRKQCSHQEGAGPNHFLVVRYRVSTIYPYFFQDLHTELNVKKGLLAHKLGSACIDHNGSSCMGAMHGALINARTCGVAGEKMCFGPQLGMQVLDI